MGESQHNLDFFRFGLSRAIMRCHDQKNFRGCGVTLLIKLRPDNLRVERGVFGQTEHSIKPLSCWGLSIASINFVKFRISETKIDDL